MLSFAELERATAAIAGHWVGYRLDRAVQEGDHRVVLTLYGRPANDPEASGEKRHMLLTCSPRLGRLSELEKSPRAPEKPPAFTAFLKAHLVGARLTEARIAGADRQLALRFSTREGDFDLLLSLLGARSNLYVLSEDQAVVAALRPLEQTRKSLSIGERWVDPPAQPGGAKERESRFESAELDTLLRAIEEEYGAQEDEARDTGLMQTLRKALRKNRKQAQRRLDRIEAELSEADQADGLQRQGELLKSVLGKIEPGASEVIATHYETGEPVAIPLDPARSPKENLELAFKRYHKLIRRLAKAGGQVDDARARCEELEQLEERVEMLAEQGALGEIEAIPEVAALLAKHAAPVAAGKPTTKGPELPPRLRGLARRLMPRRYRSLDGLEIWVGRSDEGNDHLTTRLARGNDLFFHVDGAPGSHVILRTEGRTDAPSESILDACELAVRFSKQKNATRTDVHVVPIKQVKKPKGAKRGLVWVSGGKSIHLRRDEGRLERVLSAKIDDA